MLDNRRLDKSMLDKKTFNRKRNGGFTLMEVLLAMFVLSVGMLGSTGMMLQGRAESVKVNYESKAMQLALGMAEQMRANITGVTSNAYDAVDTASAADPGCVAVSCSVAAMAQYDAYIWGETLKSNLPKGVGTVAGAGADSLFTITVNWTETQKTTAVTGVEVVNSYVMIFQP